MALSKITNLSILDDTIVNADINNVSAAKVTAGTMATARLGSGTASSTTVLYGDQTYKTEPTGGKVLQVVKTNLATTATSTSSSFATILTSTSITLASASNYLLCFVNFNISLRGNASVTTPEGYLQLQESDNTALHTKIFYNSNITTSTSGRMDQSASLIGFYSPGATSEAPLVQYKADQGGLQVLGLDGMLGGAGGSVSSITVMEIAA